MKLKLIFQYGKLIVLLMNSSFSKENQYIATVIFGK
jgi:hypothetical protein